MTRSFGTAGESAREQAERRRREREELERLARREQNWRGGAIGEESTAAAIMQRCPGAVVLHDRRMPHSRANIDHIVLVASGVWVIDSKRPRGRISVVDGGGGVQKLLIAGRDRTELVHKLTRQVNLVTEAVAGLDPQVRVYGGFCFWLPEEVRRGLSNPFTADNGLPILRTWTINGYPLFTPRQLTRRLRSAGTLTPARAEELGAALTELLPPACTEPTARLTRQEYRERKEAEHAQVWEAQRAEIEKDLGGPVPGFLADRLEWDGAVFCHHALWHCRVYLTCVRGRAGRSFAYKEAARVVASLHNGTSAAPQWRALNGFLEHLRALGLVDFERDDRGRIERSMVCADGPSIGPSLRS